MTTLTIPGSSGLDGVAITPDGSRALVTQGLGGSAIYSIAAPFTATSAVEQIPLAGMGATEDISISADGLYALTTGNSGSFMGMFRAPFTAAGATACQLPVTGGRGAGAVRFLPTALQPPVINPLVTPPADIPTMGVAGMAAMALLAGLLGMFGLRRRKGR